MRAQTDADLADYEALSPDARAYLDALRAMAPDEFQRHRQSIEGPWLLSRRQVSGIKRRRARA
jgi:hypothetical protein